MPAFFVGIWGQPTRILFLVSSSSSSFRLPLYMNVLEEEREIMFALWVCWNEKQVARHQEQTYHNIKAIQVAEDHVPDFPMKLFQSIKL